MTKYDLQENGRFCYTDFLRHFILNLKPAEEPRSLLTRRQIQTPKIVVNFLTDVFYLARYSHGCDWHSHHIYVSVHVNKMLMGYWLYLSYNGICWVHFCIVG